MASSLMRVTGRAAGYPEGARRILAVHTQRIGDVICFTPMLSALRRRFPGAWLAALVQPPAHELLAGNPDVDSVIVYDPEAIRRDLREDRITLDFARKVYGWREEA